MTQSPEDIERNKLILARLKSVLPEAAYNAAKKSATKGPLAMKLAKNADGETVFAVVALQARTRMSGEATPFHAHDPSWTLEKQKGFKLPTGQHVTPHHLEATYQESVPQHATKRTEHRGKRDKTVFTLNAVGQPLRWEGTRAQIQKYLDNHPEEYAIVARISAETAGFDIPDEQDAAYMPPELLAEYKKNIKETLERAEEPVLYIAGTKLLAHDSQMYTSTGSWGDVVAAFAINVAQVVGGAVAGVEAFQPQFPGVQTVVDGMQAIPDAWDAKDGRKDKIKEALGRPDEEEDYKLSPLAEDVLGSNDAKKVYDQYGLVHMHKDRDWARQFIENELQFHVCVAGVGDELPGSLASKKIPVRVREFDDEPMAVYALSDVKKAFNTLMDQILREITTSAASRTKPPLEKTKGGAVPRPSSTGVVSREQQQTALKQQ
jgi:hypothetical protein